MMAAFNVSMLNDFNYTETTHFIDPMEQRYRAKDINTGEFVDTTNFGTGEFSIEGIQAKSDFFSNLDAYTDADKIEDALVDYWNSKTVSRSSTVSLASASLSATTLSKVTSPAVVSATKTSTAKATSTCKSGKNRRGVYARKNGCDD
jgi:bilirubin oxidase